MLEPHANTAPRWRRRAVQAAAAVALVAAIAPATASAQRGPTDLGGPLPGPTHDLPEPPPRNGGLLNDNVHTLPFNAFGYPGTTAAANIVVDRDSGDVLGSKSPDMRWAPASTTKIMTGLLAVEAINDGTVSLNDTVTIQDDVNIEGGGSIGLSPGDTISLRDLLNIALIESKNDAAAAVGTYVGSQPGNDPSWMGRAAFVQRMNDRAAEIGLTNTRYINIAGRDPEDLGDDHSNPAKPGYGYWPTQVACDGNEFNNPPCAHYTTARDLAALARVALDEPKFATIVGRNSFTTTTWRSASGAVLDYTLDSTNQLLPGEPLAYTGAYGVKTGTTHMARENLVSAAKNAAPDTGDIIAVVLGSDDDPGTTADRFTDSRALLDWGLDR
jgi:D-alanyl-D-alanine carboxypeptidase (penicillin-binding protein 5/6)